MSDSEGTSQPGQDIASKKRKCDTSAEDQEELRLLDEACAKLRKIVPAKPYYLTIPADPRLEYHKGGHDREAWKKWNLLEPDEEYRRHLTYQYHEPGESLIQARTDVDDERDRRQYGNVNGTASGSSTPLVKSTGLPKKKINLSDYKAKKLGGVNTAAATAASTPKEEPETKEEKQEGSAMTNGVKKEEDRQAISPVKVAQGRKRPLEDASPEDKPVVHPSVTEEPPAKKARISPLSQPKSPKEETKPSNPHGLPPLISPIQGDAPPHGLPAMLSPGLPATIEDELGRLSTQPGTPLSAEKPVQSKPMPSSDPIANKIQNSLKKSEEIMKRLSDNEDRKAKHDATKEGSAALRSDPSAEAMPPKKRQRRLVRMKYGKKNRKRVEQILKLPSKNARQADRARSESLAPKVEKSTSQDVHRIDSAHRPEGHNINVNNRDRAISLTKKDIARPSLENRKHADSLSADQYGGKRPRTATLDSEKRPSTPLPPATKSPVVSSAKSSVQKLNSHLTATPYKDLQALKMQRSVSSDSNIRTPQQSAATPKPQPTSAPNGTASEVEKWAALSKKYNDLGRKIKHEWQATAQQKPNMTPEDRKRSAVQAIQCLLCYVLAFHCNDTGARMSRRPLSLENTWVSMLPMWASFQRVCQPFPHLEGLRYYLGIGIRNAIAMTTADRIALARKSGEATGSEATVRNSSSDAPTPTPSASGGNASSVPSLEHIRENTIKLAENAREAAVKLSVRELSRYFPDTWHAAADEPERPAVGYYEKDSSAMLTGKFWLPVCADSAPIQVVRFGLSLLKEWIAKEDLNIDLAVK